MIRAPLFGSYSPRNEGDMRLWLDAGQPSSMTVVSTQVTVWKSLVGGVQMVKSGANGPVYNAAGWDGSRPACTFNPTGTYSDIRASGVTGLTDFLGTSVDATLIARLIFPAGGSGTGFLMQSYLAAGGAALEARRLSPKVNVFWSSGGASANGGATYTNGTAYTYTLRTTVGANFDVTQDASTSDIASTAYSTSTVDSLSFGGGALLGNNPLQVKIGSILMYKSFLSAAAISRVHAYLAALYP